MANRSKVTLRWRMRYKTSFGERVAIIGDHPVLGEWNPYYVLPMTWCDDDYWWEAEQTISVDEKLEYKYVIVAGLGDVRCWEPGRPRKVTISDPSRFVDCQDWFRGKLRPEEEVRRSAAFRNVIFQRPEPVRSSFRTRKLTEMDIIHMFDTADKTDEVLLRFRVRCQRLATDQRVYVSGSNKNLGNWKPARAVELASGDHSHWGANITVNRSDFPFHYKYMIKKQGTEASGEEGEAGFEEDAIFETGPKRESHPSEDATEVILSDEWFWYDGPPWKGCGIQIPLFSIRTSESVGVGEFLDLIKLVDWAKLAGIQMIQMLPINDTSVTGTWWDSYPYSSVSVFALHPIYINLAALDPPSSLLKEIEGYKAKLDRDAVEYEAVMKVKMAYLRQLFRLQGKKLKRDKAFLEWADAQSSWLPAYALFSHLKAKNNYLPCSKWPEHSSITPAALAELTSSGTSPFYGEIMFHYWLQYHLSQQMSRASQYAGEQGVVLKGDLPIGVDPNSADVWEHPELFNLGMQTGAPPDYFAADGQNWGFPTYNWEEMAKDNYQWWRNRLRVMSRYFHAYRIDHVLGFFRIWEIPGHCVRGLLGHFSPCRPITLAELHAEGLAECLPRLTEPYVREAHFDALGKHGEKIKRTFFDVVAEEEGDGGGVCRFKEKFRTEANIEAALTKGKDTHDQRRRAQYATVKRFLWDRLAEVILLPDPRIPDAYHLRIDLFTTHSFRELPDEHKQTIGRLYEDFFYRRQDADWAREASRKLRSVKKASNMMICAEDLGMVPGCVQGVMDDLGLLGLRVQRMPRALDAEFDHTEDFQHMCVATPSSHDTSSLRGYWEEDADTTARYYANVLGHSGTQPSTLTVDLAREIVGQHLESQAMWTVFLLQDLLAMSDSPRHRVPDPVKNERINIPSVRHHYWRYRMPVRVEDLVENDTFTSMLRGMMHRAGRCCVYPSTHNKSGE